MDLTNDTEAAMKALFQGLVVNNAGKEYLLTAIDKNCDSYYEAPKHPQQASFSFIDAASPESLAAYLTDFWNGLGTPEFGTMSKGLSELAFKLSADSSTQSDDVSPFVYAMY